MQDLYLVRVYVKETFAQAAKYKLGLTNSAVGLLLYANRISELVFGLYSGHPYFVSPPAGSLANAAHAPCISAIISFSALVFGSPLTPDGFPKTISSSEPWYAPLPSEMTCPA